ncbi:hypothetical protein QTP88_027653 [Uroleucon formosanum]
MHEQVEALSTGKYFVQLDLANGYLQLPLTKDAQEKTAFVTPDDTGHFTRMPFGLAGAPGEFTRLMHKVLGKLRNTAVKNYLDDWVVDTTNWTEMLKRLREVLMRLRFANLTLKSAKCSLGAKYIEFLGFVIGGGTICPDISSISRINWIFPEVCRELCYSGVTFDELDEDRGAPRLVYCISKKLTEAETKYHSGKLELIAVIWAVNKWRNFLLGIKFTIVTDCQALVYLRAHRALRPQVARWHDLLQEYEYDIQHLPGTKMAHVDDDALSRTPVTESGGSTLDDVLTYRLDVCMTMGQEERVLMAHTVDVDINAIIEILKKPEDE